MEPTMVEMLLSVKCHSVRNCLRKV